MTPAEKSTMMLHITKSRMAIAALLFAAPILLMLLLSIFCLWFFSWSGHSRDEETGMSYREFIEYFPGGSLDPFGASNISGCSDEYVDQYNKWLRMEISEDNYEELLSRFSRRMARPFFRNSWTRPATHLLEESSGRFPENWPRQRSKSPNWWLLPKDDGKVEYTLWECEVDGLSRTLGWYWAYDSKSKTLWIWEWNYQHVFVSEPEGRREH